MSRPKPTAKDLRERKERAEVWKTFRSENLFTQRKLAEVLRISRRTVQQIEAAKVTPHPDTQRMFLSLKRRHDSNKDFEMKENQWLKAIT